MAIQCRLISSDNLKGRRPGDMWFMPWYEDHPMLSPEYNRDWKGKRPPICIVLPNGHDFIPDMKFADLNGGFKEHGWTITGEIPNITISPSINQVGKNENGYHGWLINGILSDDIEGRTY